MRHVNSCFVNFFGNSKYERKIVLFADARYSLTTIPPWLQVSAGNLNISQAIEHSVEFQRSINMPQLNSVIKQELVLPKTDILV